MMASSSLKVMLTMVFTIIGVGSLLLYINSVNASLKKAKTLATSSMPITEVEPKRVTYITGGTQPTWQVGPGEAVVSVRIPEKDTHLAYYTKADIIYYNNVLQGINQSLPWRMLDKNIMELTRNKQLFPTQTQELLLEWSKMTKNSLVVNYPLKDLFYHVRLLLTKTDPDGKKISCKGCFKQNFKRLLVPEKACSRTAGVDIVLVGIVTTVPGAYNERRAIRETWGKWTQQNQGSVRVIFLIGGDWPESVNEKLRKEQEIFGDILQEDYKDSYYNLSYKVISGLRWAERYCRHAQFIMRTAGDSFVHIPNILKLVSRYGHEHAFQDYQVGRCLINFKPYRWIDYKGYVSTDEYDLDTFPPYALGTTFLFSMKLTREIIRMVPNTPYMSIEDSYFGILLWQMGRGCHHVEGFVQYDALEKVLLSRVNEPIFYAQHPLTPEQMHILYSRALTEKNANL